MPGPVTADLSDYIEIALRQGVNHLVRARRVLHRNCAQPLVRLVYDAGVVLPVPVDFSARGPKRASMAAAAIAAKLTGALAILVITESYYLESEAFEQYFHLAPGRSFEQQAEDYRRIMERYNHSLEDLPKELRSEGLMAAMKGPGIEFAILQKFHFEGDVIVLGKRRNQRMKIPLIPRWWSDQEAIVH